MSERAAKREQMYQRSVILSAAKDLLNLVDAFEHCEIPRRLRGSGSQVLSGTPAARFLLF
jgi:hypothetical protein